MRCPSQLHLAKGSAVGRALVRNSRVWDHALLLQELAHQLLGRAPVALGLDQNIEHLAFGIHRTLQVHLLAADPDEHLVEVPARVRLGAPLPQSGCDHGTEG